MHEPRRVAVVSGANRGIGLEVCRQLAQRGVVVILGSRDQARGEAAALPLIQAGLPIHPRQLDLTDQHSITRLRDAVAGEFGRIDILVNNAAIHYDTWQRGVDADLTVVREALETNLIGHWAVCEAFIPLMRQAGYGRIVNVSSGAGSLAEMGAGTPAYSVSKAALNALTRILAAELRGSGILVNAICPGWVATDMGGRGGRPVEQGAAGIVWAAALPDDGPTGGFFRDQRPVQW